MSHLPCQFPRFPLCIFYLPCPIFHVPSSMSHLSCPIFHVPSPLCHYASLIFHVSSSISYLPYPIRGRTVIPFLFVFTGAKHRLTADSNRGFVMPEVNIIIITNVMMRGTYLDEYISENAKFLGFWEHISSLGFKTIGARMTSLNQEQVDALLAELKLSATEHRIMVNILFLILCFLKFSLGRSQ